MTDVRERLEKMLNVEIIRMEEHEDRIIVYVPKNRVKMAVGSGGAAVRSAELVLGRKIEVRGA